MDGQELDTAVAVEPEAPTEQAEAPLLAPQEPVTPEASEEDADAKDRAVLDKLAKEQAGEETGGAKPDPETEEEPEPEAADAEEEPKAEEPEKGEPEAKDLDFGKNAKLAGLMQSLEINEGDAIDAAIGAYRRDGALDDEAIELLFERNPSTFVEGGLKRVKAQRDQDRFGSQYRELEQRVAAAPTEQDASESGDTEVPTAAPGTGNDAITKVIAELQEDEFYGDIAPRIQQLIDVVRQENQSVIQAQQQQLVEMRAADVDTKLDLSRVRHTSEYPDLKDDAVYEKVLEKYDTVITSGKHSTVESAFAEACDWELGKKTTDELTEKLLSRVQQRRKGKPKPSSGQAPAKQSIGDMERQEFYRLRKEYGFAE